jgi:fatty-acyl-CoA synthase
MVQAADYLAFHAHLQPGNPAVQDLTTGQSWSYRAFDRLVAQYATALRAQGIGKGDRVAALARNRAELLCVHLACARIGAMYVPLNWRLSAGEIKDLIADAEPRILLADAEFAENQSTPVLIEEFAAEAHQSEPLAPQPLDPGAPSLILYTSGTSGRPKGVMLSERNIWQTALNFSLLGRVTHESAVLCDSPMFHIIGLVTTVRSALMRGARFIASDGFEPRRTLARLADPALGVTHYFCVPQMAAMMRADASFDPGKLRRLTAIFSGGAPHAADAIRAWTREGIAMADGFGMSEAGTVSCMPLDLERIASHAGSAGIVPPGLRTRIVDEQGNECPAGEAGEILLKGDNVTCGYWHRPQDTEAAFLDDGWLRTGDVARFDEDGFLWLVDRKKDMFISGGENVYPAEIENVLAGFPHLAECAVVGVADERWGEVGHLVLVPRPHQVINQADVALFLESRLARYKIPKHMSSMTALPRNAAGKISKSVLRSMLVK